MRKVFGVSLVGGLIGLGISLLFWSQVPANMPIHWNAAGQPDRFASKEFGLLLFPALTFFLPMLIMGMTKLDPRRDNVEGSQTPILWIIAGTSLLMLAVHGFTVYASMTKEMSLPVHLLVPMIGLFFAGIGALLPRIKSNWFVGIRTPWTLSSEKVWERTHRVGGRWMMAGGLLAAVVSYFLPGSFALFGGIALLVLSGLVPVALSYIYFREEQQAA